MKVAVGVIYNEYRQVLIAQRPLDVSHGGQWEFPGGKIELGESPLDALIREIQEEVGLIVKHANLLTTVEYQYPTKSITLFVYQIFQFEGIATCCETQLNVKWVDINQLIDYDFPAANQKIIQQLICY